MDLQVPRLLLTTILASLTTWLLLAGVIVIPTVVTFIIDSHALDGINKAWNAVLNAFEEIPSLVIATTCCICGIIALSWVCLESKDRPAWMTDCILLCAIVNSIVSILAALASVYSPQSDHWAVVALETIGMALNITIAAIVLLVAYSQLSEDFENDYVRKVHTA